MSKNRYELGWGTPYPTSEPSEKGLSIYAPDFFLKDPRPWWNFPFSKEMDHGDLLEFLKKIPDSALQARWNEPDFSQFSMAFSSLQRRFETGELKKGVPVAFQSSPHSLSDRERATLVKQIIARTANFPLFVYGFWNATQGILGATPEILFGQTDNSTVHTMALAGTRFKSKNAPSLFDSKKDLTEHQLVIEGIRESLSGLGSILCGETQELELPTLFHLLTPIRLELSPENTKETRVKLFTKLVRRLHPTPALGAFPKEAGMQWLASDESGEAGFMRTRFGAPFGIMKDQTESRCLVAIRNIQWTVGQLRLGAGCGVIATSQLDKEWEEILGKLDAIQRVLFFVA